MISKQSVVHIVALIVISLGLIYLTDSFWMSLGIILLLIVADYVIADIVNKKKKK
jgi:hypothetical protein